MSAAPAAAFTSAAATAASAVTGELPNKLVLDRREFEDTCNRRFIFGPAFDPYGGTSGLFDYGPVLCAMKANFLQLWRTHFIVEEQMCEIDSVSVTPHEVLLASGHVERFNDWMVRDTVTGECIRLDKYVNEWLDTRASDPKLPEAERTRLRHLANLADGMNKDELQKVVEEQKIKSSKGNALSEPFPFNLMFPTVIGPEGDKRAFMRPELAQGLFLNFKRLVDTGCAQRMPFGCAAIGQAYRNEIAPRNSLLRVREFTLAEIEFFINPNNKAHAKFDQVKNLAIWAWDRAAQVANRPAVQVTIGSLVANKTIDNETLAFFVARTALFLEKVGAKQVRFRQHLATEMAHYAQDCWDAELLTSFGWCECVGIADRSAYDLTCHMKATGKDLRAREQFAEPRIERVWIRELNKKVAAKSVAKDLGPLEKYLLALTDDEAAALAARLAQGPVPVALPNGNTVSVLKDFVTIEQRDVRRTGYEYVPSVVEPSFGVGRILYAILEQSYYVRKDDTGKNDKRAVFALQANLASQKVAVLPLLSKPQLEQAASQLVSAFLDKGVPCRTDDSGTAIGKKYARTDEIGIPFAITVDFGAIEDGTVTLRERDSTEQVRVPLAEVVEVVSSLSRLHNPVAWSAITAKYPALAATAAAAAE